MGKCFQIPILFITYNRIETVKRVFDKIKQVRPKYLYLASDGPKNEQDKEKVDNVRTWILKEVNWECEVFEKFSEINLGCKFGPFEAINWVFSHEEKAIILEDDVVPDISFFSYCQKMLDWYEQEEQIMLISGYKDITRYKSKEDYFFSRIGSTWGWATWKRAWEKYDIEMKDWPEKKDADLFWKPFSKATRKCLTKDFDKAFMGDIDAWDYQWYYCRLKNHGLSIVPSHSLVENIGYGELCGTHTVSEISNELPYSLNTDLLRRKKIEPDYKHDTLFENEMYRRHLFRHLIRKFHIKKKEI